MPRTTASLFVAAFEQAFLTVGGYVLYRTVLDSAADGSASGLVRWAVAAQSALLLTTVVVLGFLAGLEKKDTVRSVEDENGGEDSGDEDESVSGGRAVVVPSALLTETANAYCSGLFVIALCVFVAFLQAYAFGGDLNGEIASVRRGGYASSERQDWVQFVFGTAGWEQTLVGAASGNNATAAPPVGTVFQVSSEDNVPIIGGILFGVVFGYIVLMLLLSMYGAYSATPVGKYAPLVFEARGLTVANTVLVLGVRPAVRDVFARCGNGDFDIVVSALLTLLMCFDDHIIMAVLYIMYALEHKGVGSLKVYRKNWDGRWWQALWMSFVALVPPMIAGGNVGSAGTGGNLVLVSSLAVSILALLTIWSRQVVAFVGALRVGEEEEDDEEDEEEQEEVASAGAVDETKPAKADQRFGTMRPFGYAQYRELQENMRAPNAAGREPGAGGMPVFRAAARAFETPAGNKGGVGAMMQMGGKWGALLQQGAGQAGAATNAPLLQQQQPLRHDKVW